MQRIEDAKLRLPHSIQDLQHMGNTIICFCSSLQAIPYFASLGNEIVVWIDHKKCSDLLVICHLCHASFQRSYARGIRSPSDQMVSGTVIYATSGVGVPGGTGWVGAGAPYCAFFCRTFLAVAKWTSVAVRTLLSSTVSTTTRSPTAGRLVPLGFPFSLKRVCLLSWSSTIAPFWVLISRRV